MAVESDALNYPYIRVRSADWLKRTLLIFPHVVRMTPKAHAPADDPEILPFTYTQGARGKLLQSARLWDPEVKRAQKQLVVELDNIFAASPDSFLKRFQKQTMGREDLGATAGHLTVWEKRELRKASFQIHRHKLYDELVEYLRLKNLAWSAPEEMSDGPDYLEMNPRLGEAIMASLANACADNEGLQVITEFPDIHGRLLGVPRGGLLQASLQDKEFAPSGTSERQIAEFLVFRRCGSVQALTVDDIAALQEERAALASFRAKLEDLAATIPANIRSEAALTKRLEYALDEMFDAWRSDQAKSKVLSKFFGDGVLAEPERMIRNLAEAVFKPETAAAAAAGVTSGGGSHMLGLDSGLATAAGFAVAIFFRTASSAVRAREAARNSPYRYLSVLEKKGVVFSFSR